MAGTLVGAGVVVGVVGEAETVAVAGAGTGGVVTVCVVAVADGIIGDATTVVDGADRKVPPTVPDGDCSGLATGVWDDVGESVALGVAVAAFVVVAGDGGTSRPVTLDGGVVFGVTMGEGADVPVGVVVCGAEGCLIARGIGDAVGAAVDDS